MQFFSADRFARLLTATNAAELNMHSTDTEETDEDNCNSASLDVSVAWPKVNRFFLEGGGG